MDKQSFEFTPDLIKDILIRRRWYVLVSLFAAIIAGFCMMAILPLIYEASTTILIEPQRVPENYVQSIVSEDESNRVNTITRQILSRANLEGIIKRFNVFPVAKSDAEIEYQIETLRDKITIDTEDNRQGPDAFTILVKGKNPQKIRNIANGLATSFIEQNMKFRESQAIGTSKFLEAELEATRKRLEIVEDEIKKYRKQYMGELPEQLETNLRIMERLQANLTERQQTLRDAKIRLSQLTINNVAGGVSEGSGTQSSGMNIFQLRSELESMEARYTSQHPDIIRIKKLIKDMESGDQSSENGNLSEESESYFLAGGSQAVDINREVEVTQSEIERIKSQIQNYEQRIENTPRREQELLALQRDYREIQASFSSLMSRKLEADIALSMERKQKGEQFRIIDPARIPYRPVEPNMARLFLLTLIAGLGLGFGIPLFLEYINTSFSKPDELEAAFGLPVLTVIPELITRNGLFLKKVNDISSIACAAILTLMLSIFAIMTL